MPFVGSVTSLGGPLVLASRQRLADWPDADLHDDLYFSLLARFDAETPLVEVFNNTQTMVAWGIEGKGQTYVTVDGSGVTLHHAIYVEHDDIDEIVLAENDTAVGQAVSEGPDLEVGPEGIVVFWSVMNLSDLTYELDTVRVAATPVALVAGVYSTALEHVEIGKSLLERLHLRRRAGAGSTTI